MTTEQDLCKINTQAGREILRMNRARRQEQEISLAAKASSDAAKKDAALASLHPSSHLGDSIVKGAHVGKEEILKHVPKHWQKPMRMHFDSIPDIPPEATQVVIFTALSSVLLFCQCTGDGQTAAEAAKTVLSTTPAMAGFGVMIATVQKFIGVPLVKNIMQGLMLENDVQIGLLGASLSSFFVGVTWDFCSNCMQLKEDGNWWEFGDKMLRSFVSNSFKAALYGTVAFYGAVPLTVAVCVFGAFAEEDMRQKYRDHQQPYLTSLGKFLWRSVTFVPCSMYNIAFASDDETRRLIDLRRELIEDHCPSLICSVTDEKLENPVYLNGLVVSRNIAVRQINSKGRDFYNEEAVLEDIKELPEFERLLRKADRIVKAVREGEAQRNVACEFEF